MSNRKDLKRQGKCFAEHIAALRRGISWQLPVIVAAALASPTATVSQSTAAATLPEKAASRPVDYLSIDAAVGAAVQNSPQVKIADWEHKIASANYQQTHAVYLPQVSVGYQAVATNNPLNAFGFLLQQGTVTAQDFAPDHLNHPGATQNFGASIDTRVPLLNLDMTYARKGARLQQDVLLHRLAYTKSYLTFQTRKAYTQLQFAYRLRNILRSTLDDIKQIQQSVAHFYEQGLAQRSDLLNAQVQVSAIESALAQADSNIENASQALHLLMGHDSSETQLYVVDSLAQVFGGTAPTTLSSLRPDLMAMGTAVRASRMMEKSTVMALLPKINAFGSYQLNDSKAFGFHKDSYLAGISLTWNLFSGYQNMGKIRGARLTTSKLQQEMKLLTDESRLQIDKATRELRDRQIEINKHQSSVAQADEALRILNNRYHEGLSSTTDCLSAQAQLSQQRMALAQAVMAYNITKYHLELLTSDH